MKMYNKDGSCVDVMPENVETMKLRGWTKTPPKKAKADKPAAK